MALLDTHSTFALDTAPTLTVGTAILGTAMDLGATPYDVGPGYPMFFVCDVAGTAVAGLATSTMTVKLTIADNSALTTAPVDIFTSQAYDANAGIAAGTRLFAVQLPRYENYKQYLGVRVTVGAANMTAGTLNVYLTTEPGTWQAYADAAN